ncbi:SOS response-associated peptidase [Pelagicoccus sp. SDUM812002]|uniref:SOS response-associated peptidase n=1 Tax=Pelagicoccus sp. SDUM812002 TaxID=3041266 RepID=UPI00280F2551|nr:SOS response-associated peptidase [Pelagicoccus sp. SDUM812002]MDQ8186081.1 SOS response-associated peptidase [Pelagicoccus sp. SDUM812002]
MCGRYTLRKGLSNVAEKLGNYLLETAPESVSNIGPRFNIAPTQNNLVLRKSFEKPDRLQAAYLRWGLIPSWSKTPQTQAPMINARSETVADKPSFRAAFQRRRCLIPADGFYEWKKSKGVNQPYFFSMADDSVFLMAGIWETWVGDHQQRFDSYTILTTNANSLMAKYHERMPVILAGDRLEQWLEPSMANLGPNERHELLSPIESELMSCQPANPIVNNNRSEGPKCLTPPESKPIPQLDLEL